MAHVNARDGPRTTECDNLPDFREGKPQTSALLNEGQDSNDVGRGDAGTGGRPACGGKNAARFVQPHGLAADTTPLGNLTDQ